jgi:GT2 family glycosyltransferase
VYDNRPERVWCAGVTFRRMTGRTVLRGHDEPRGVEAALPARCDAFPSVFLVRVDCFDAVEGFDAEAFPMHCEEADLAARLQSNGWTVVLAPTAVAHHDLSGSDKVSRRLHLTSETTAFFVGRGRTRFILRRRLPVFRRCLWLSYWLAALVPVYLAALLVDDRMTRATRVRYAVAFVRGVLAGLRRSTAD